MTDTATKKRSRKKKATYPREDVCTECGAHVGWIMNEMGEMFALGLCDDHLPELPDEEEDASEEPKA